MVESGSAVLLSPGVMLAGLILLILLAAGIIAATVSYVQRSRARSRGKREGRRPVGYGPVASPSGGKVVSEAERAVVPSVEGDVAGSGVASPTRPGEVMRVYRDPVTGAVEVEVDGRRYRKLKEITDGDTGRRVLLAIADLIRFTEGLAIDPSAVRKVTPQTSVSRSVSPGGIAPSAPPRQVEQQFLEELKKEPSLSERVRPTDVGAFLGRAFAPRETADTGIFTFVDEVDKILQRMLENHPVPIEVPVHFRTASDGGLEIVVGARTFSRIEDVDDPEIRGLLRAAVEEWERMV